MKFGSSARLGFAGAALLASSGAALAGPATFTGSSGSLSAEVTFEVIAGDLVVTLSNTGSDVLVPADVLTAVFFDMVSSPSLTPLSAVVPAGSSVLFGTTDPGDVVGGEWAEKSGLSGAPGDASYGVSSVGLDLFGPPDLFPGTNLQGPASPNGLQYGITSAVDNPTTGNTPVTGTNALIQSRVVFTIDGIGVDFDPMTEIGNVWFQYGTSLDEPSFPGVPEPTTLALLAIGAGLLIRRRTA